MNDLIQLTLLEVTTIVLLAVVGGLVMAQALNKDQKRP